MMTNEELALLEAAEKEFFEKYPDCPVSEPVKCLDMVLAREAAEKILRGERTVELRPYTRAWCDKLFDYDVVGYSDHHVREEDKMDLINFAQPLRPVEKIHFHPKDRSWWLDVEVVDNYTVTPIEHDADFLFNEYGDPALREMAADLDARGATDRPVYFYFALGSVLGTNLR